MIASRRPPGELVSIYYVYTIALWVAGMVLPDRRIDCLYVVQRVDE
jgi:hypothetical protein